MTSTWYNNDSSQAYNNAWANISQYASASGDDGVQYTPNPANTEGVTAGSTTETPATFSWYAEPAQAGQSPANGGPNSDVYVYTVKWDGENQDVLGDPAPIIFYSSSGGDKVLIKKSQFVAMNSQGDYDFELYTPKDIIYLQLRTDGSGNKYYLLLKYTGVTETVSGNGNSADYLKFSYATSADAVCLTDTCDILTPNGYVNIKDLSVGDLVTTPEGKNVKITKVMKPTTHYAMGKAYPHFIPKNSLGKDKPTKDTFVSKNHAYKSGDIWLCGQKNSRMCVQHNTTNWNKDFVTYYNIMTEDYPKHTLVVNGVEMECWGGYERNKPETHGNVKLRREKIGFK